MVVTCNSSPKKVFLLKLTAHSEFANTFKFDTIPSCTSSAVLQANMVSSTLLEYPYHTNCFDYTKTAYLTQSNCVDQCVASSSFSSHNFLYSTAARYKPSDIMGRPSAVTYVTILRNCTKRCSRTDCYSEQFITIKKDATIQDNPFLYAILPTSLHISTNYIPKLNFCEFILYYLGVVMLWIGLDVLHYYDAIVMFVFPCKK